MGNGLTFFDLIRRVSHSLPLTLRVGDSLLLRAIRITGTRYKTRALDRTSSVAPLTAGVIAQTQLTPGHQPP